MRSAAWILPLLLAGTLPAAAAPTVFGLEKPCGDLAASRSCMPATIIYPAMHEPLNVGVLDVVDVRGVAESGATVFLYLADGSGKLVTSKPFTAESDEAGRFSVRVTAASFPAGASQATAFFSASVTSGSGDTSFFQTTSPSIVRFSSVSHDNDPCDQVEVHPTRSAGRSNYSFPVPAAFGGGTIDRIGMEHERGGHHFFWRKPAGATDDLLAKVQAFLFARVETEMLKIACALPGSTTIAGVKANVAEAMTKSCITQLGSRAGGGDCALRAEANGLNKTLADIHASMDALIDERGGCFEKDKTTRLSTTLDTKFSPLVEGKVALGWIFQDAANMYGGRGAGGSSCGGGVMYISGISPLLFLTTDRALDLRLDVRPARGRVSFARPGRAADGWRVQLDPRSSAAPIYYEVSQPLAVDEARGIVVAPAELDATLTRLLTDAGVPAARIAALIAQDVDPVVPATSNVVVRLARDLDRQLPLSLSEQPSRSYRLVLALEATEHPPTDLLPLVLPRVPAGTGGLELMELGAFLR